MPQMSIFSNDDIDNTQIFFARNQYKRVTPSKEGRPYSPSSWWHKCCWEIDWNEEQLKVLKTVLMSQDNLLLNAKAGGGKSTLLKAINAIISRDDKALNLAFNRHIAEALKESGCFHGNQTVSTLHSIGLHMLTASGLKQKITIKHNKIQIIIKQEIDSLTSGQRSLFHFAVGKERLERLSRFIEFIKGNRALSNSYVRYGSKLVGMIKKTYFSPEKVMEVAQKYSIEHEPTVSPDLFKMWKQEIEQFKKVLLETVPAFLFASNKLWQTEKVVDFDDMIYLPNELNLPVSAKDIVLVDECQDLNMSQILLINKFVVTGARVIAVGDPQQSIYGFTGALPDAWETLKKRFSMTELDLTYTFRCPTSVVDLVVNQTHVKDIQAIKAAKEGLVEGISTLRLIDKIPEGALVLSRFNAPLIQLCVWLNLNKKIARVRGRMEFCEELIDMLKPYFPMNNSNWLLIGKARFTSECAFRIKTLEADGEEMAADVLRDKQLCCNTLLTEYSDCQTFQSFCEKVQLLFSDEKVQGITLSSIHKGKGDEADTVFLLGYPNLPYRKTEKGWQWEQEKNLLYVALTRAKQSLYLVDSDLFKLNRGEVIGDDQWKTTENYSEMTPQNL